MSLKNKNLKSLNDYIDRLASSYITDFSVLKDLLRGVDTDANNQAHLDWCLAHYNTAMVDIHKTLKNIQARLREIDANTKIQD
jgi:hypothetical protein